MEEEIKERETGLEDMRRRGRNEAEEEEQETKKEISKEREK